MTEADYPGPDRRKSRRLKKPLTVRIQAQAGGAFAEWDIVLIKDIGRLGLSFNCDKPLKEGALLNLKINISLDQKAITCVGKVLRVEEMGATNVRRVGVAFVDLSESDAVLIDQLV